MADPRAIHEFLTGEVEATTLILGDFLDMDAQSGYTTYKMSVSDLGEVILEDIEYTQELQTADKTIVGAINELHAINGYSYDAYDPTRTSSNKYEQGDLCIKDNTLYKCNSANGAYGAWDPTKWDETSIAKMIEDITEITTGTITPETGVDLSPANAILETRNGVTNISISLGVNGTATLARWGNTKLATVSKPPRTIQRYLTRARLGPNDWFSVLAQIDTNGDLTIFDTFGVTAGIITGCYLSATYLS